MRELENAIERAVVLSNSEYVDLEDLPQVDQGPLENKSEILGHTQALFSIGSVMTLEDMNKRYIEFIFKRNLYAKEQTAKELGIDRKTLYRKLKELETIEQLILQ